MKSVCDYMQEDKIKWKDRPYISVKENGRFAARTFGEVISDAEELARGLISEGVRGNVMLYSPNSYYWTAADLAVLGYVGTLVPIDSEWTAFDIERALSVIEVGTILYSAQKQSVIDEFCETHSELRFICIESEFPRLVQKGRQIGLALAGNTNVNVPIMILFTSGTTDHPKAIPLTARNLLNNADALFSRTPMSTEDVSYVFLPLNHVYAGVANFLYTLISGMQIFLCSDKTKIAEEMMEVRPTIVCTVPLILIRLRAVMTDELMECLRRVRFLYCGGSFTDPDTKRWFIDNGVHLLEAYGTTETSSVIALAKPDDSDTASSGTILDGLDVRVFEPDENGIGEIIVSGGSVFSGYITHGENYGEIDSNGFYHTGDLGYIDDERRLFLKGRKRRMMITANGKNVYLDELEELILKDARIRSAAVFEENYSLSAKLYTDIPEREALEYIEKINERLPKFKRIKRVYVKSETNGGRLK